MFKWLKRETTTQSVLESNFQIDIQQIPKHVAIIMDGNGRWAKKRSLPRIAGHKEGMEVVKKITRRASNLGVEVLTMYAFSTENWKRPKDEVEFLMKLPTDFLGVFLPELVEKNVRVQCIGEVGKLPKHTQKALHNAMNQTCNNTGMILNFALNYGGQREIVLAVQEIVEKAVKHEIAPHSIDEQMIEQCLMTKGLPNVDLLIRTSGELRISNFLLWQIAYSEFVFFNTLWPDFTENEFDEAVKVYQQRTRRFGGI